MVTKAQQLRQKAIDNIKPKADLIEQEVDRAAEDGFMYCEIKSISKPVLEELHSRGMFFIQKTKRSSFTFDWSKDPEPEVSDLPWDQ